MIALVSPFRSFSDNNVWGNVRSLTPPLGLISLAAYLEENGFESFVIDADARGFETLEQVLESIPAEAAYVGITVMTVDIK